MARKKKQQDEKNGEVVADSSSNEVKKVVAKAAAKKPSRVPRKSQVVSQIKQQRTLFSIKERKSFLKALKEKGFQIINTPEELTEYLPERSVVEIRQLIAMYNRKSQEKQKSESEEVQEICESSPIEGWYSIIDRLVPPTFRKADFAAVISRILEELGEAYSSNTSSCDNSLDYCKIYKYLAEVTRGEYPTELNSKEAAAVIELMKQTSDYLMKIMKVDEIDFIKEGSWWSSKEKPVLAAQGTPTIENNTDQENQNNTVNVDIDSSNVPSTAQDFVESNLNDNTSLEDYLNLPKMRKISECLNPLKVPISLLKEQHSRLSQVFQASKE